MKNNEHKLQCACVAWFRLIYPTLSGVFFAVPNGGQRNARTGAMLKKEGVLAGVSDLILMCPSEKYHGLFIEMKTAKGVQLESQKAFQKAVQKYGYCYKLVRSFDDFRGIIKEYLDP